MLHENMNISHLTVHAQQVEESMFRRKNREDKRAKHFESGSLKGRLEIQYKPIFKKWFSNKVPYKFPKARDYRVPKPKSQKVIGTTSPRNKPTYGKCGKKHWGECLVRIENCFVCGKSGHKVREFQMRRVKTRLVDKQVVQRLILRKESLL